MSNLEKAKAWALRNGYSSAEALRLRSGETVYLLQANKGEAIGYPKYIKYTQFGFVVSSHEESVAIFGEPAYMDEG